MYEEKTTEAAMLEPSRGLGLVGGGSKTELPMPMAFMSQEKALAELEMMLEQLERRLDPISTRFDEPQNIGTEDRAIDAPTSELVRAFNGQTQKIHRITSKVRRMTNELEV